MDTHKISIAQACLEGAQNNSMSFRQIVGTLIQAGIESYAIDFRRCRATYDLPDGSFFELPIHKIAEPVSPAFNSRAIQEAIGEAQAQVPGYTYLSFCEKIAKAGCIGYIVSFSGRRALYFGRTAETHVEHFPN